MVRIKNCVAVLGFVVLAACATEEPVMMVSSAEVIDGSDEDYEIVCKKEREVGSRIEHSVCRIEYAAGSALQTMDDIHKENRMQEMANSQIPKRR